MKGIIGRSTCLPEGDLSEHQEIYAENNFDSQTSHLTVVDNMTRISDPRSRCVNVDVESTLSSAQPPDEGKGATAGYPADHMSEHQSHRPAVFLFPTALPNPHAHILLVQHNAVNRKIMTKFAEKSGYQVTTVENGQEALDYLCRSSQRPRPKAVLMECSLFPMNGYATTRRIRHDHVMFDEETRNLPIIGLTIPAVHGHVDKCFDAGMDDYLLKPVKLRVFQSMLAKWTVARRSYKLGHIMDAKL
jgi:CheY-like chemotaxis protein